MSKTQTGQEIKKYSVLPSKYMQNQQDYTAKNRIRTANEYVSEKSPKNEYFYNGG